jgi:hypothetical protein
MHISITGENITANIQQNELGNLVITFHRVEGADIDTVLHVSPNVTTMIEENEIIIES